jgi:putative ABC transport system ATP-binding protein
MATLISLRNVTKSYQRGDQRVEVLRGVNLEIAAGEFLSLMGPSGSGKTTLLNLIGGLDVADAGQVHVAGQDLSKLSHAQLSSWRARHVGLIFQFYHLLPTLSAEHNVEVPLYLTRLPRTERRSRAHAALALVGLSDRRDHKPGELSGGQQQRVALARAMVSDPTLLVCDEPTGDLDRESSESILALLQQLNREQGKTIVMVTHDPRAAECAGRQVHLDKGVLSHEISTAAA